jgi:cytoskeleton protein RodZ
VSAMPVDNDNDTRPDDTQDVHDATVMDTPPVVVRRHAGLAALIGAAASAVAIAYLWRASQTMTALDWTLCAVMAGIAAVYLASLVDSRTPLLVADDLGVRIRLGHEWRGLPWEAIGQVIVHPRRGPLRDGRVVVAPHSLGRALDGLDAKGRRHVSLNQKMYGAALAVPVGITTRVSTDGERSVAEQIAALAHGRAEVVGLERDRVDEAAVSAPEAASPSRGEVADETPVEAPAEELAPAAPVEHPVEARGDELGQEPAFEPDLEPASEQAPEPVAAPLRRSMLGGIGTIVSRVA